MILKEVKNFYAETPVKSFSVNVFVRDEIMLMVSCDNLFY